MAVFMEVTSSSKSVIKVATLVDDTWRTEVLATIPTNDSIVHLRH